MHLPGWILVREAGILSRNQELLALRQRTQGPEGAGFAEIDFCADTLESSHAYLELSAAWPNTFGAGRNTFRSSERQLRNDSRHSHPRPAQGLHFSSTGGRRHRRLLLWRAKAKRQGQTA